MSKVLQSSRTRRLPSVGGQSTISTNLAPFIQQVDPVVIEMSDEDDEETGDLLNDLPPEDRPIRLSVPRASRVSQSTQVAPIAPPVAPQQPRSCMSKFKRFFRRMYRKFGMKHMITLLVMIIYTVIGAAMFLSIEKGQDELRLKNDFDDYESARLELVRNLSASIVRNWNGRNVTQLETLANGLISVYDENRGCKPSMESIWNFWHAMYFAGTIYTTIGYGDIFCRSRAGRVATMLYSIVGIPLMLMTLTDLGGLLLKFMFKITQVCDACKSRFSPRVLFGPHPPGYDLKPSDARYKSVLTEMTERRQSAMPPSEKSAAIAPDQNAEDEDVDLYELERKEDEDYEYQLMRVPVLIALFTTIGWIFCCAALFCIWEHDWDYFTSVYFFFISLSTVGLGDETPRRKDIMVATYLFVIIGLSLVSMCITVIQRRLEDLYMQLLQMILQEYHRKLMESGGDQTGATVGMMQAWQKSKTARFLMPLLSKDKKKTVAKKFQDEAKAQGIVLPPVLRDLNPKSGLPAVLHVAAKSSATDASTSTGDDAQFQELVEDAIQRAATKARLLNEPIEEEFGMLQAVYTEHPEIKEHPGGKVVTVIPAAPPPPPIAYDANTQTELMETEDKQEQTAATPVARAQTQTELSSFVANSSVDETSQTPVVELDDTAVQCRLLDDAEEKKKKPSEEAILREEETQTDESLTVAPAAPPPPPTNTQEASSQTSARPTGADEETQTEVYTTHENFSQTSKISNKEEEIQTHLYDLSVAETQTEQVQTKNQRLQTPIPEILEQGAQTDPLILDPEQFQATGTLSMSTSTANSLGSSGGGGGSGGWARAKKNLKNAIKLTSKSPKPNSGIPNPISPNGSEQEPAMATWNDVVGEHEEDEIAEEEEGATGEDEERRGSEESLHWDPVDGLHAEPKMNVRDLKKMFEQPNSIKRHESDRRSTRKK